MDKLICDKCGSEIEKTKDKSVFDNRGFIRFGNRELTNKDLCDNCICEFEIFIRSFFDKEVLNG